MSILIGVLSFVYVLACLFLIFVVLIQKGEGGGLGGAFGGGAVDVAFGSSADTTWKRVTSLAAAIFICLSIVLGLLETPPKSKLNSEFEKNTPVKKVDKDTNDKNPKGPEIGDPKTPEKKPDTPPEKKPDTPPKDKSGK